MLYRLSVVVLLVVAALAGALGAQGSVTPVGWAPATTSGHVPGIGLGGRPYLGQPMVFALYGAPPASPALLFMGLGYAETMVAGCPIYIDPALDAAVYAAGVSGPLGDIVHPTAVPNWPAIVGVPAWFQWVILTTESLNGQFATSPAIAFTAGDAPPAADPFTSYVLDPSGLDGARMTITGPGVAFNLPVTGSLDIEYVPTQDPNVFEAHLVSISAEFPSITRDGVASGPVNVVRSPDVPAVGLLDVATGSLQIPMMSLSFLYAGLGQDPMFGVSDGDNLEAPPFLHFMSNLDAAVDPVSGQILGNLYWWSAAELGAAAGATAGAILKGTDGILRIRAPKQPAKTFRQICLDVKVVRDNAGMNAAATVAQVNADINTANAVWAQCCVRFVLANNNVTFIDNTGLLNLPGPDDGNATAAGCQPVVSPQWNQLRGLNVSADCLDVYYVTSFVPGAIAPVPAMPPLNCPQLLGGTTGGGTANAAIVLRTAGNAGTGDTLAHEIGHAIGNLGDLAPANFPNNVMRASAPPFGNQLSASQCRAARQGPLAANTMVACNCAPAANTP